jgi:phosphoenolpyruvate carboxykinase (ATP)
MAGPFLLGRTLMNAVHNLLDPVIRAQLAVLGLRWANCISWNAVDAVLYQEAIARSEAEVTAAGGLVVETGAQTGRSPKDKFIVVNAASAQSVWWDQNQPLEQAKFDTLKADMLAHARLKSLFVQDLLAGADAAHQMETRVITEHAWQALFIRHLLIKPDSTKPFAPKLTIICLPSFHAEPARHATRSEVAIAMDLKAGLVLIAGTHYAGEIKKAVFTAMNHRLPLAGVLPMHCAANTDEDGDTALFFGLSGTGKTTLSTDPKRTLIGDDEHGWSKDGIFNIEGGCYAKAIRLSAAEEPAIHAAASRWGVVLENVDVDPDTREADFNSADRTENTRVAYPLAAIANASRTGQAKHPKAIIMLTADAFGVLPPIAKLTDTQAMYHFMSGYTAKVSGTERGVTEPLATFSACFGAPFLTHHPRVYADLLKQLMEIHKVPCYLVNTGWTGGGHAEGHRMPLPVTRALVKAALSGEVGKADMRRDENFGFLVPKALAGIDTNLLNPKATWRNAKAYDEAARKLVDLFDLNFEKFSEPAKRLAAE